MSVRSTIETAVRAWLVAAGASGGISTPDAKVVFADEDGVRPALPYVVIKLIVYDVPVKEDESWVDDSSPPEWSARGLRTGTVSLNAFGATAEAWLDRAHLMLGAPAVRTILGDAGMALRPRGGINNLSGRLDESTQVRFQRDYAVDYRRDATSTEVEVLTELGSVVYDTEIESDTSPTRTVSTTEVL